MAASSPHGLWTNGLEPAALRRFLRTRGWQECSAWQGRAYRFTRQIEGRELELEIPASSQLADNTRRVHEALEVLALLDGSSVAELLASLANPSADIVRFRFTGERVSDGSIGLDDAIRLRAARRQLLLSVAHSVVEPLAHFPRLSRAEPSVFIASCRELVPERGSYVSAVSIPVSPAVGGLDLEAPFPRRVTELLARAVSLTASLVATGDDGELLSHAQDGVSSNFLAALADLAPPDALGSLDIEFAWAATRPAPTELARRVRLAAPLFAPLGEAARVLRETTPAQGCELEGYIARLERSNEAANAPGQVVLVTSLDERPGPAKVHVELGPEAYARAASAHLNAARVRITGTLEQQDRRFVLRAPGGLAVVHEAT